MDSYCVIMKVLEEQEESILNGSFNKEIMDNIRRNIEYLLMKVPITAMAEIKLLYCKVIGDAFNKQLISEQQFNSAYTEINKRYEAVNELRSSINIIASCVENLHAYGKPVIDANLFDVVDLNNIQMLFSFPLRLRDYIDSQDFRQNLYDHLVSLYQKVIDTGSQKYYLEACSLLDIVGDIGLISKEISVQLKSDFMNLPQYDFFALLKKILDIKISASLTSEFGGEDR